MTADMKFKNACSLEKSYGQPRQHIKKQRTGVLRSMGLQRVRDD